MGRREKRWLLNGKYSGYYNKCCNGKSAYNIPRGIDEEISHALDASEQEEVKTKSVFTKQLRHFAHSISKQNRVVCNILCF